MEVHHHPKVEKKNFKEYLFEGLMIFLAVMLGFFAESLRESLLEKERVHGYMEEMVGFWGVLGETPVRLGRSKNADPSRIPAIGLTTCH